MKLKTSTNMFLVILLAFASANCAKKLPEQESRDVKETVLPVALFDNTATIKISEEAPKALAEEVDETLAINEKGSSNIEVISADAQLRPFFHNLTVERFAPGEELKISFKLTKEFLVAYAEVNNEEMLSAASKDIQTDDKRIPLFQYPIDAYGIKRRALNGLGEETRDIEFVSTNKSQANFVKISTISERRKLAGLLGLSIDDQQKVVLKNRLENKTWNTRQLRRLFQSNDALKVSAYDQSAFSANQKFILKSYEDELYIYRAISRAELTEREQIAQRFGFIIRAFKVCSEKDAQLAQKTIDNCFLRSEYKTDSKQVYLSAKKDSDDQLLAESEIKDSRNSRAAKLIYFNQPKLNDTIQDLARQVPAGGNRFLFAIEELTSPTVNITLKSKRMIGSGNVSARALEELALYDVEYKGPEILKEFFEDLQLEATGPNEIFKIKLFVTPTHLIAYYERQTKFLPTYLSAITNTSLVPLFQYRIHSLGTIERIRNHSNEDVDLEFKPATYSNASHIVVPNMSSERRMAGLRGLDINESNEYYVKSYLNNSIMTFAEFKATFNTSDDHKIEAFQQVHVAVTDRRVILSLFKSKDHLNTFEKQALNLAGATPLLSNCTRQEASKVSIDFIKCIKVAAYSISSNNIEQKIEKDEYGYSLVTVRPQFLDINVASRLINVESGQSLKEYSISSVLRDDVMTTLSVAQIQNTNLTLETLNSLIPGNDAFFAGLFQRHVVQSTLLGNTLYLLRPKTFSELTTLERGMIGRDPRYNKCSNEQARISQLNIDDCVMSAAYSIEVQLFGLKSILRDGMDAATIIPDYTVSPENAALFEVSPRTSFRRFEFDRNLRLQDSIVLSKDESFDLEDEYLYLPSTHDAPKDVVAADPFFQGNEKIVKLKFSEAGLNIHEVIEDPRFRDNKLNESPVMTIQGQHIDFTCAKDRQGTCTDEIVQDSTESWQSRKFFKPNLDQIDVKEVNTLNLFTVSESCIQTLETKMTQYEIKKGVINIEVERTFKINEQSRCIVRLFYDDKLSSASFKVKYFYSLIRLKDLASPDYEKVAYPIQEQDDFGFFKTEKSVLNNTFDDSRSPMVTWINRFNPKKGTINYRLSKSFDRPENASLKEATYKVIENLNKSLVKADAGFQIKLEAPSEFNAGDLRNNSIVLIDDPLANGLLGYGPSVANPRTGEIVQAHTNMYGGVLRTLSRHVYQSMVDLRKKELQTPSLPAPAESVAENAPTSEHMESSVAHQHDHSVSLLKTSALKSISNAAGKTARLNTLSDLRLKQKENTRHQISNLDFMHSLGRTNSRDALANGEVREMLSGKSIQSFLNGKNGYELMLERYSKNNAYHKDFLLAGNLGKTYVKGILEIPGVLNSDNSLKHWEELTPAQQEVASNLIVTHAYTTTLTHELGHNLGLRHNFTGSADKDNFYTAEEMREMGRDSVPAYSSIMDYGFSELNELPVMGKYDIAALRFAYARQVETEEGNMVNIPTTLTDLKESEPALKVKKYDFCTDENAGLSVKCNRFDEGTTITEIAQHYIEKYNDFYKYRNFRDGRNDFSTLDVGQYVWARTSEFRRMRVILEDFEFFGSIFGKDVMSNGCNAAMTARYPICKEINDRVQAAKLIGGFFVDIINMPERLCVLATKEEPTTVKELRPLVKIYEDIKYNISKKIVTSCFEPEVNEGLKEENLIVVAEGGKSLTSYKGTDPRYRYKTDIDVMGIWPDKVLAMKTLFTRLSHTGSTEDGLMSFMDIPEIAEKVEDFLGHIILDRPLENKIPFTTQDGSAVEVDYKLNLDNYAIPEQAHWHPIVAFSLPYTGTARLNEIMLKMAASETQTTDPEFNQSADDQKAALSVYRNAIDVPFTNQHLKTMRIGQYVYASADNNVFANKMIDSIESMSFLTAQPKASIIEVFTKRARPTVPSDLSDEQKLAFKVPDALLSQLVTLIEGGVTLESEQIIAQFGPELGASIMAAYGLGVEGIRTLIEIKQRLAQAPADATAEVKRLYSIDLETLQLFLTNKLEPKIQFYRKSLPLLPSMNGNLFNEIMNLMMGNF